MSAPRPQTVLFLHAYPLSGQMWADQKEALEAAGLRVLAPDLPGFGGQPGRIETLREAAENLLATLPPEPLSVVGLSMGGYLTLELLAQAPERFRRVVLADTTARPDSPDKAEGRRAQARRVLEEGPGFIVEAARDEHPARTYERVRPMIEAASAEGIAGALEAMAQRSEGRSTLQALEVPLLVLVGREDTLTPMDAAQEIADAGRGELVVLDGAGHLSNLDAPEAFTRELLRFLA